MDDTFDARLVELELRYTQQAELVEQLSDQLFAQQRRIDTLEAELGSLRRYVASASSGSDEPMPHEAPPHY